ncbi:hypothetical protein FRC03_000806 [Tulasnella sp. 419]|nr:hypothetical protein FRC03_000806 [Tulasnella sp. 419]
MSAAAQPSPSPSLRVPAFVGGVPNHLDFAPSIVFVVLYGLLFIPVISRLCWKQTRIGILWATVPWMMESLSLNVLRALVARSNVVPGSAEWIDNLNGADTYCQVAFSIGYIAMATDCCLLFRCLLVNTTLEDRERGSVDKPEERAMYRRYTGWFVMLYWTGSVPGMIAGGFHNTAFIKQKAADMVFALRYVSSIMTLLVMLIFITLLRLARRRIPHIDTRGVDFITTVMAILCFIPVYRLSVMHNTTSSFEPYPPDYKVYPPGNLSNLKDKVCFYIFHTVPEFLTIAILVSADLRRILNTGPWGDYRANDKKGIPVLRRDGLLPMNETGEESPEFRHVDSRDEKSVENEKDLEAGSDSSSRFGSTIERLSYSERLKKAGSRVPGLRPYRWLFKKCRG